MCLFVCAVHVVIRLICVHIYECCIYDFASICVYMFMLYEVVYVCVVWQCNDLIVTLRCIIMTQLHTTLHNHDTTTHYAA